MPILTEFHYDIRSKKFTDKYIQKLESVFTKVIYVRIFILSFRYSRWTLITLLSKLNEGILHKHIAQSLIMLFECMKRIFNHAL